MRRLPLTHYAATYQALKLFFFFFILAVTLREGFTLIGLPLHKQYIYIYYLSRLFGVVHKHRTCGILIPLGQDILKSTHVTTSRVITYPKDISLRLDGNWVGHKWVKFLKLICSFIIHLTI